MNINQKSKVENIQRFYVYSVTTIAMRGSTKICTSSRRYNVADRPIRGFLGYSPLKKTNNPTHTFGIGQCPHPLLKAFLHVVTGHINTTDKELRIKKFIVVIATNKGKFHYTVRVS